MYKFEYYGASEVGKRPWNEDNFLIFKNKFGFLIAAIADGMGGHKGGGTASKSVVKMVKRDLKDVDFSSKTDDEIKDYLLSMVRTFQKDLKRIGKEFPELADMGTTLNLCIFVGNKLFTINIGDSRTQSFTKKEIIKISIDHNLATLAELDPKYAHFRGVRNMLTSSLGPNKTTKADFFVTELEAKKGYVLITTDGVHNCISKITLMKVLKTPSETLEDKVSKVIKIAFENGSNDNMTFILIKYER